MHLPGEPQNSVSFSFGLNFVLKPKSHNFRSRQVSFSTSKVMRIFSGFRSENNKQNFNQIKCTFIDVLTSVTDSLAVTK